MKVEEVKNNEAMQSTYQEYNDLKKQIQALQIKTTTINGTVNTKSIDGTFYSTEKCN